MSEMRIDGVNPVVVGGDALGSNQLTTDSATNQAATRAFGNGSPLASLSQAPESTPSETAETDYYFFDPRGWIWKNRKPKCEEGSAVVEASGSPAKEEENKV